MFSVNTLIDFYLHYQPQVFHIVFLCLNQLLQHIPAGDTKRRNDYKLFHKIKNSVFLHKSHPKYIYILNIPCITLVLIRLQRSTQPRNQMIFTYTYTHRNLKHRLFLVLQILVMYVSVCSLLYNPIMH